MKKIHSLLCVIIAAIMLTTSLLSASAAIDTANLSAIAGNDILGDVDGDGDITIIDGTKLQRHLADMIALSDAAILRADADLDGIETVIDVTHLQRFIAKIGGVYYLGMDRVSAIAAKERDEEAARQRLAEEKALAEEEAAMRNRTQQAEAAYNARLVGLESLTPSAVEQSIRNYQRQKGVDISEHNGDVDFNKLKAAGYTFVMIRLGWGGNKTSQDDAKFEENVRKAEEAGIPWGAYLYSYALTADAVKSEIKHTLRLLKGKRPTMPIAFDIEDDDFKYEKGMPSDQMLHDICMTYLQGIEAAGYYPILYTGYDWLTGALNKPDLTGTYDVWYAQWYTVMQYNTDKVGIWQYGGETNYLESPTINGLSGPFDKNFCFKNYPVIITAYGYNNHPALIDREIVSTSSLPDEDFMTESGDEIPEEYKGVMGESFRKSR